MAAIVPLASTPPNALPVTWGKSQATMPITATKQAAQIMIFGLRWVRKGKDRWGIVIEAPRTAFQKAVIPHRHNVGTTYPETVGRIGKIPPSFIPNGSIIV